LTVEQYLGEEISRCTTWFSKYVLKEGKNDLRSLDGHNHFTEIRKMHLWVK
jgi:hypothetical protein